MSSKINKQLVNIFSIAIPLAVALLLGIPYKLPLGLWTKILPHGIGIINTLTTVVLITSFYFIKSGNVLMHKRLQYTAIGLGAVFLVLYVVYHISNEATPFGGDGWIRPVYYFLLISHILLSIGVVRLVLLSLYYAVENDISNHKKMVKWSFPIWLYVSISGVLVYLLISPYYN